MTGRELVLAAFQGSPSNSKPRIVSTGTGADAQGFYGPLESLPTSGVSACFGTVLSPLGNLLAKGRDIYSVLESNPEVGEAMISEESDRVRQMVSEIVQAGADGVLYELEGAYPAASSPMQYGGHFLEVDRELMAEITSKTIGIVWVCGKDEPYLDFVSDLAGHAFGWESEDDMDVASIRAVRTGLIVGSFAQADLMLSSPCESHRSMEASVI